MKRQNPHDASPAGGFGMIDLTDGHWTVSDPSSVLDAITFDGTLHSVTTLANAGVVEWTRPLSDFIALAPEDTLRFLGKVLTPAGGWSGSDTVQIGLEASAGLWLVGGIRPTNAVCVESDTVPVATNGATAVVESRIDTTWLNGIRIGPLASMGLDAAGVFVGQRQFTSVLAETGIDTVRVHFRRTGASVTTVQIGFGLDLKRTPNKQIPKGG